MKVKHLLLIFILIISSCNSHLTNPGLKRKSPPPYSLLVKDLNSVTPEYIKRMEKYNTILKSCPIPIFIMDINDLPEKLKPSLSSKPLKKLYGLYIIDNIDGTWPDEFIFINKNNSPESIIITFFHESQHYQCRTNKCYCFVSPFSDDEKIILTSLKEKHSMENELRESLKLKDPHLIANTISSIANYILYSQDCAYKMAATSIAGGELWNKSYAFLLNIQKENTEKVR